MRLADHILASRDTMFDLGTVATSFSAGIKRAERFELRDEVVHACIDLLRSKPSSLIAALPLCRLPYPTMWFEMRGGVADTHPGGSTNGRDPNFAPTPLKQGILVEGFEDMQSGIASLAWMHHSKQAPAEDREAYPPEMLPEHVINFTPIAVYFDFKPDGNVRQLIVNRHAEIISDLKQPALREYVRYWEATYLMDEPSDEVRSRFMKDRPGWEKLFNNQIEIEASKRIDNHMMPGISHHGAKLIELVFAGAYQKYANGVRDTEKAAARILDNWTLDVSGEGTFLLALIALLNSKNRVIQHQPVDVTKVNKARVKRGRQPFLSYVTTNLVLNRTQRNVVAASQEAGRLGPGLHPCRGHFKVRKTGVFWWNPFLRGDPAREVVRTEYQVKSPAS